MNLDIYVLSNQGGRSYMEDTFCLKQDFAGNKNWIFGGVFDGHRGWEASQLAAEKMPEAFLKYLKMSEPAKAFQKSYQEISDLVEDEMVGCTALSFFIKDKEIWIANAGDGRMIAVKNDETEQITNDHNLGKVSEQLRVLAAGGPEATHDGYVWRGNDGIMPTRSLGDRYFRPVGVISDPEVFQKKIDKEDLGYVAATDGLWEVMTNQAIGEIVKEFNTAKEAAEMIMGIYLNAEFRSMLDNVTIIVIKKGP